MTWTDPYWYFARLKRGWLKEELWKKNHGSYDLIIFISDFIIFFGQIFCMARKYYVHWVCQFFLDSLVIMCLMSYKRTYYPFLYFLVHFSSCLLIKKGKDDDDHWLERNKLHYTSCLFNFLIYLSLLVKYLKISPTLLHWHFTLGFYELGNKV